MAKDVVLKWKINGQQKEHLAPKNAAGGYDVDVSSPEPIEVKGNIEGKTTTVKVNGQDSIFVTPKAVKTPENIIIGESGKTETFVSVFINMILRYSKAPHTRTVQKHLALSSYCSSFLHENIVCQTFKICFSKNVFPFERAANYRFSSKPN